MVRNSPCLILSVLCLSVVTSVSWVVSSAFGGGVGNAFAVSCAPLVGEAVATSKLLNDVAVFGLPDFCSSKMLVCVVVTGSLPPSRFIERPVLESFKASTMIPLDGTESGLDVIAPMLCTELFLSGTY